MNGSVAGNYYPVDSVVYMQEEGSDLRRLTVMTDRAQGAASIYDGEIEVMVHILVRWLERQRERNDNRS